MNEKSALAKAVGDAIGDWLVRYHEIGYDVANMSYWAEDLVRERCLEPMDENMPLEAALHPKSFSALRLAHPEWRRPPSVKVVKQLHNVTQGTPFGDHVTSFGVFGGDSYWLAISFPDGI